MVHDNEVRLAAGEVLFHEGDPPTTAFILEEGQVEIASVVRERKVVLAVLGPGAILGEMAVIDDAPRTATARAVAPSRLLALDRTQIAERLQAADPVVRSLLEGTLQRYRRLLGAMQGQVPPRPVVASMDAGPETAGLGKMRFESQLRAALGDGGLAVRYQPLLDLGSRRIAGFEALVRWEHPHRGAVSPLEFVALAEETSLIIPIGEYVFDAACEAARDFAAAAGRPIFVAVNVSVRQLRDAGLLERLVARLEAARLDRTSIKIEITESQAMDIDATVAFIDRCHACGIQVALDDFGTGFSHLAQLHRLPFDAVKVDQRFVRDMLMAPRSMAIVEAIVALARGLDARVVVEGVERSEELDVLRRLGCDYAQGWLVGRPQSREALLARGASLFSGDFC